MTKNWAASVIDKLNNYARSSGTSHDYVFIRYINERILYRLSKSKHKDRFVLKGSNVFIVWESKIYRPTKDIDLLGFGDFENAKTIFEEILSIQDETDGLSFDLSSLKVSSIREQMEYGGQRIAGIARIGNRRYNFCIDIGIGDSIHPAAKEYDFPTLLPGYSSPRLRCYPVETVIAEKLEAICDLEEANSRLKDFYDLHFIMKTYYSNLNDRDISNAILKTFQRRRSQLPTTLPVGLTDSFCNDQRLRAWNNWLRDHRLQAPSLPDVVAELSAWAWPLLQQAATLTHTAASLPTSADPSDDAISLEPKVGGQNGE